MPTTSRVLGPKLVGESMQRLNLFKPKTYCHGSSNENRKVVHWSINFEFDHLHRESRGGYCVFGSRTDSCTLDLREKTVNTDGQTYARTPNNFHNFF